MQGFEILVIWLGKYETRSTLQICGDPAATNVALSLGCDHIVLAVLWALIGQDSSFLVRVSQGQRK